VGGVQFKDDNFPEDETFTIKFLASKNPLSTKFQQNPWSRSETQHTLEYACYNNFFPIASFFVNFLSISLD